MCDCGAGGVSGVEILKGKENIEWFLQNVVTSIIIETYTSSILLITSSIIDSVNIMNNFTYMVDVRK